MKGTSVVAVVAVLGIAGACRAPQQPPAGTPAVEVPVEYFRPEMLPHELDGAVFSLWSAERDGDGWRFALRLSNLSQQTWHFADAMAIAMNGEGGVRGCLLMPLTWRRDTEGGERFLHLRLMCGTGVMLDDFDVPPGGAALLWGHAGPTQPLPLKVGCVVWCGDEPRAPRSDWITEAALQELLDRNKLRLRSR